MSRAPSLCVVNTSIISEKGVRIEKQFLVPCIRPRSTTEKSHGKKISNPLGEYECDWKATEDEEQQKQTNSSSANENSNVTEYHFIVKNILNYAHIKELLGKNCFIWRHQSTLVFLLPASPANTVWDFSRKPAPNHKSRTASFRTARTARPGRGPGRRHNTVCWFTKLSRKEQ